MTDHPDLVATAEAITILGYKTPSSVTRLVAEGKLTPAMRLPSAGGRGAFLFHRADVEALRDSRAEMAS